MLWGVCLGAEKKWDEKMSVTKNVTKIALKVDFLVNYNTDLKIV